MPQTSPAVLQRPAGAPPLTRTGKTGGVIASFAPAMLGTVEIIDFDDLARARLGELVRSVGLQTRLFGSVHEFLASARPAGTACVVADVRLPAISGLELQAYLKRRTPGLPVVLMTAHADIAMVVQALKAGASDFLEKPYRDQHMLEAIGAALEQDRCRRAGETALSDLAARHASLSGREKQVLILVTAGLMNKQVAGELGLSEITVKIHRGAVMRKMRARTLPELVRMADALAAIEAGR